MPSLLLGGNGNITEGIPRHAFNSGAIGEETSDYAVLIRPTTTGMMEGVEPLITQEILILTIPNNIKTYLAWTFTELLPGTFRRNKIQFAHLNYPILAPLPSIKSKTRPIEGCGIEGPFIYFVLDGTEGLCYLGKSEESNVIKRWVRPGIGGSSTHYWSHSTPSGGSVFNIAEGLRRGEGPFSLRYTTLAALLPVYGQQFGILPETPRAHALKLMENGLIITLSPIWNK